MLAVVFAVFILVVVRSIFEGFGDEMRQMVRGTTAHLVTASDLPMNLPYADEIAEDLRSIPHVVGASPYIEIVAMKKAPHRRGPYSTYLHIRGIDPVHEADVGDLEYYLLRQKDLDRIRLRHMDDMTHPIGRALSREPLTAKEIRYLFSSEHRDKLWQEYKKRAERFGLDPEAARVLDRKLPPPIVVGIQAILGGLVRYGSIVQLTTFSPQKEEVKIGEFLVVGAFHTGLFEVDQRTVYMPLGAACEFADVFDETLPDEFGEPVGGWRVSGVGVAVDDYEAHKDEVIQAIRRIVGDKTTTYRQRLWSAGTITRDFVAQTETWEERKKTLLRAVKIEKLIVSLIIGLLTVFVGAIIFLILTLNVSEKRRDLGILKAVGSHGRAVFTIFLLHGGTICFVGLVLGFLSGLIFCQHINAIHDFIYEQTGWKLFPPDVYYLDRIPVSIKVGDLAQISGFTVLFAFLGSLLPAIWAARQDPIQAIRFE